MTPEESEQRKTATKAYMKAYRLAHRDKTKVYQKIYRQVNRKALSEKKRIKHQANREHDNAMSKAWRKTHPTQSRDLVDRWHKAHPDRVNAIKEKWYLAHKDELMEKQRQIAITNPKRRKKYDAKYRKETIAERYHTDPEFKLAHTLRSRLNCAIRKTLKGKKCAHTMELLGCTVPELMKHLESQFNDGMTWDNHGIHGWVVDHIKPVKAFVLTDPDQQRQCFHRQLPERRA